MLGNDDESDGSINEEALPEGMVYGEGGIAVQSAAVELAAAQRAELAAAARTMAARREYRHVAMVLHRLMGNRNGERHPGVARHGYDLARTIGSYCGGKRGKSRRRGKGKSRRRGKGKSRKRRVQMGIRRGKKSKSRRR